MQNPITIKVPTTSAELEALTQRRDEMSAQLENLTEARGKLLQERMNAQATNSAEVVKELSERITEHTARISRLSGEQLQADDAIGQALANGITRSGGERVEVFTVPPPGAFGDQLGPRRVDEEEIVAGFLGFTILAVLIWQVSKRRALKKAGSAPAGVSDSSVRELKHAVDAIAIEVERISENQRFVTALLNKQGAAGALAEGEKVERKP